jgi:hypothetical protein
MTHPGQFLLSKALNGAVKVDVYSHSETVWLTQKAMTEVFGVQVQRDILMKPEAA